jgi:hypothetical protein
VIKDCSNCGGIHFGSYHCPYTEAEGAAWKAGTYEPSLVSSGVLGIPDEAQQQCAVYTCAEGAD